MRFFFTIPLLLLLTLGACKKPVLEIPLAFIPPLVLSTSIQDSLPPAAVRVLGLGGVSGLKIKHHNGMYASYFEYEADKNLLLSTISTLPFSMDANKADTRCHLISLDQIAVMRQDVLPGELENTTFFLGRRSFTLKSIRMCQASLSAYNPDVRKFESNPSQN